MEQTKPNPPTPKAALEAFLEGSGRHGEATPISKLFLQRSDGGKLTPSPLASLVRRHDNLGLTLYLLLVTAATAPPWDCTREAIGWARALNLKVKDGYDTVAISRTWRRLENLGLIKRQRQGLYSSPRLLREDGTGHPYSRSSPYFRLPFAFWREGWHRRLDLPGKAMLLIALDLPDDFRLPTERAKDWYGISADTAERGFRELLGNNLLTVRKVYKPAPLTAAGYTQENHYTLQSPFFSSRKPRKLASVLPIRNAS
jgi:hypothetical protein